MIVALLRKDYLNKEIALPGSIDEVVFSGRYGNQKFSCFSVRC
jgi:hypothetical protein